MYHNPVLRAEAVELLNVKPGGIYVDATFGGGGHSAKILECMNEGTLLAFDKDPAALRNKLEDRRLIVVNSDYKYIAKVMKEHNLQAADGILADLGISSRQVDDGQRGFSFRFDAPLDMRMDTTADLTAFEVVNTYDRDELIRILREFGELFNAYKVADAIVRARITQPIRTTTQLESIVAPLAPVKKGPRENADRKKFLAQVFQAIRIEVNGELDGLEALLQDGLSVLKPGGRMVIISYHSLEDRRVKNFFRTGNFDGELQKDFFGNPITPWKLITRKAMVPSEEEIENNPRARSAKLRVAEKLKPQV